MKIRMLAAATAAMLISLGAHAAPQEGGSRQNARAMQLDTNGDGVVDRAEAAQSPRLARHFERLDRDGDGRLTADELRQTRQGKGSRHARGPQGVDGLARLDTDGDGRISRAELEAAQARREAHRAEHAQRGDRERGPRSARSGERPQCPDLLANFDAIDTNRDGVLDRRELHTWLEAQRPQREAERRQRLEARFRAADLNGDGRLSRVEVAEAMPWLEDRFAWLDVDGDGFLSPEELRPPAAR